jgi:hypothetical protein
MVNRGGLKYFAKCDFIENFFDTGGRPVVRKRTLTCPAIERTDFEKEYPLCKGLPANLCYGTGAVGLCPP